LKKNDQLSSNWCRFDRHIESAWGDRPASCVLRRNLAAISVKFCGESNADRFELNREETVKKLVLFGVSLLAQSTWVAVAFADPVTFGYTGGFVDYTAPTTEVYAIQATGAGGGAGGGGPAGLGSEISDNFGLTAGDVLNIAVGGAGASGAYAGGGGGGSFVVGPGNTPLLIAAGGGGGGLNTSGIDLTAFARNGAEGLFVTGPAGTVTGGQGPTGMMISHACCSGSPEGGGGGGFASNVGDGFTPPNNLPGVAPLPDSPGGGGRGFPAGLAGGTGSPGGGAGGFGGGGGINAIRLSDLSLVRGGAGGGGGGYEGGGGGVATVRADIPSMGRLLQSSPHSLSQARTPATARW
jgi:hypothetical protein